jgi:peroxiredoxin family protein
MAPTTTLKTEAASVRVHKISIILSKGTLDMAYPAFMLANAATAMGMEAHVFFTFWGLSVINRKKESKLKVAPDGNPALPVPNILGIIPGMTAMTTSMMKGKIKGMKLRAISQLIHDAHEMGVHIHACSTTMDMMGVKREDLIPEVDDVVGAATFLQLSENGQTIFVRKQRCQELRTIRREENH